MFQIEKAADRFSIKRNFADELFRWGKVLCENRVIAGREGSLSYRHGLGFVVTVQGADLAQLGDADLVLVDGWNAEKERLTVRGCGELSITGFLHALVYQNRSAAIFTFLADAPGIAKSAAGRHLPRTDYAVTDDIRRLADDMESKLGLGNVLLIRKGGVLSFGCTSEDAGGQLLDLQRKAQTP